MQTFQWKIQMSIRQLIIVCRKFIKSNLKTNYQVQSVVKHFSDAASNDVDFNVGIIRF